MRKIYVVVLVSLLVPVGAMCQSENPKATVFGGYFYLRNGGQGANGFDGQATFNFNHYFGVTADLAGNYRTVASFAPTSFISTSATEHLYTYLFGPTITAPFGNSSVFAHALFGAARASSGAGVSLPIIGGLSTGIASASAFAMAFGGGIDIGVSRHIAIRAAQVDYVRTQFSSLDALSTGLSTSLGGGQNSFRYSGGVVFRF